MNSVVVAPISFRLSARGKPGLITCPKCDAPCGIRHSERITATVKDIVCICSNPGCGHTFRSQISFVHTISPGNLERPELNLPVCPRDEVRHIVPPTADERAPP